MLDKNRCLLIVTDVQGKLAEMMFEKEALYKNIGILIDGFKILDIPILWLEQYPEGLGPTVPEVASHLEGLEPMPKKTFSALKDQTIFNRFNETGCNQVLLIGIETHVVRDAVSSRTASNKTIGLEKIIRAGGHITSVETALFELLGIAEGEAFKKISGLVK